MDSRSNGSHRQVGLLVALSLLGGLPVALAGCPGPEPHTGLGGAGGLSATASASSTSSSSSASSTSSSSTSSSSSSSASSTSGASACPASQTCVPPSPDTSWKGPVAVYEGSTAAACPPGASLSFHGGLMPVGDPAQCTGCDCGQPNGVTCTDPVATVTAQQPCGGAMPCAMATLSTSCTALKPVNACGTGTAGLFVSVSTAPTGGMCKPTPVAEVLPPASFTTSVVGCGLGAGASTCDGGGVCEQVPNPPAFTYCVVQQGDVNCPSGPYAHKTVIGTSIDDTRGCSTCTCGDPQGVKCAGSMVLSGLSNCTQPTPPMPVPATCAQASLPASSPYFAMLTQPPLASGGMCAHSGGTPTGGVAPGNPLTLCCL